MRWSLQNISVSGVILCLFAPTLSLQQWFGSHCVCGVCLQYLQGFGHQPFFPLPVQKKKKNTCNAMTDNMSRFAHLKSSTTREMVVATLE